MYPYLVFLLIFFGLPVAVLACICRREAVRYRRTILWSVALVCAIGGPWDWLSYRTGLWRYDSGKTLGLWLWGLPVEEFAGFYLFGTLLMVLTAMRLMRRRDHV